VVFSSVTQSGFTSFQVVNPLTVGAPPAGYTIFNTAPGYNITTTAVFTPPATVCFTVLSINDPNVFAYLRILHSENGQLVDRTIFAPNAPAPDFSLRRICAQVDSLSPFVVAAAPNYNVSGRVFTPSGNIIRNVPVVLTDSRGVRRTSTTSSFGTYLFEDVRGGEPYVISVNSRTYRFAPKPVTVNSNLVNQDFVGLE